MRNRVSLVSTKVFKQSEKVRCAFYVTLVLFADMFIIKLWYPFMTVVTYIICYILNKLRFTSVAMFTYLSITSCGGSGLIMNKQFLEDSLTLPDDTRHNIIMSKCICMQLYLHVSR